MERPRAPAAFKRMDEGPFISSVADIRRRTSKPRFLILRFKYGNNLNIQKGQGNRDSYLSLPRCCQKSWTENIWILISWCLWKWTFFTLLIQSVTKIFKLFQPLHNDPAWSIFCCISIDTIPLYFYYSSTKRPTDISKSRRIEWKFSL